MAEKDTRSRDERIRDELWNSYLCEAGDLLDEIDIVLIDIESNPDSSELIDSLFRSLHTFKGTSGMMSLKNIEHAAHGAEDLIANCRDNGIPIDNTIIDLIFDATDTLKTCYEVVKETREDVDHSVVAETLDSLHAALEKYRPGGTGAESATEPTAKGEESNDVSADSADKVATDNAAVDSQSEQTDESATAETKAGNELSTAGVSSNSLVDQARLDEFFQTVWPNMKVVRQSIGKLESAESRQEAATRLTTIANAGKEIGFTSLSNQVTEVVALIEQGAEDVSLVANKIQEVDHVLWQIDSAGIEGISEYLDQDSAAGGAGQEADGGLTKDAFFNELWPLLKTARNYLSALSVQADEPTTQAQSHLDNIIELSHRSRRVVIENCPALTDFEAYCKQPVLDVEGASAALNDIYHFFWELEDQWENLAEVEVASTKAPAAANSALGAADEHNEVDNKIPTYSFQQLDDQESLKNSLGELVSVASNLEQFRSIFDDIDLYDQVDMIMKKNMSNWQNSKQQIFEVIGDWEHELRNMLQYNDALSETVDLIKEKVSQITDNELSNWLLNIKHWYATASFDSARAVLNITRCDIKLSNRQLSLLDWPVKCAIEMLQQSWNGDEAGITVVATKKMDVCEVSAKMTRRERLPEETLSHWRRDLAEHLCIEDSEELTDAYQLQYRVEEKKINGDTQSYYVYKIAFTIPMRNEVLSGMIVAVDKIRYIIPTAQIRRIVNPSSLDVINLYGDQTDRMVKIEGNMVPLISASNRGLPSNIEDKVLILMQTSHGEAALWVDELINMQQVMVKPLQGCLQDAPGLGGCAVLGAEEVGLLINIQ